MPEIYGWNRMPILAKALAAPAYADQLAFTPLKSLFGAIDAGSKLYGNYNLNNDFNAMDNAVSPEALNSVKPQNYLTPEGRLEFDTRKQKRLAEMYANQALPIKDAASKLLLDPEFRNDPEALKEFQSRPDFWLGGDKYPNNPNVVDAIKAFGAAARTQEMQGNTGKAVKGNQSNPFANMDDFTLGQITSDKNAVDNLKAIAELGSKERTGLATANYFKQVADAQNQLDPIAAYQAFANAVAGNPYVDEKSQQIGLNMMKQKFPEMKFEKAFTGNPKNPEEQILKGINPLVGSTIDIGKAGIPAAPKINVNTQVQQESEYSKKRGANLAENENNILNAGNAAENTLMLVGDARKLSDHAYSGAAAAVTPTLNRFTMGVIGDAKRSSSTTQLDRILSEMTLSRIKTFGANPTEGERNFLTAMNGKATYTPQERQQLLDITEKYANEALTKRNSLIQTNYDPVTGPRSEKGLPAPKSKYKVTVR